MNHCEKQANTLNRFCPTFIDWNSNLSIFSVLLYPQKFDISKIFNLTSAKITK